MFSETTKQLLEASKKLGVMREELGSGKKSKPTMKPLNYRFQSGVKSSIEDLSFNLSSDAHKWSESEVARAAMYLGLKQLEEVYSNDKKQATGLMHVIKLRLSFFK